LGCTNITAQANPLFSIITVTYNAGRLLERTIGSIRAQTYRSIEYIVVDGSSTDSTIDIILEYQPSISCWISEPDKGLYDAMNKGIRMSQGDWILFLNAGDEFASPDVIERVAREVVSRRPRPLIAYGGAVVVAESGHKLTELRPLRFSRFNLNLFGTRTVCHQSLFVSRDVVAPYSRSFVLKGELDWYYRLTSGTKADERLRLDLMVCEYSLGGLGDRRFLQNLFERALVMYRYNGILKLIPLLPVFLVPIAFRLRRRIFGR